MGGVAIKDHGTADSCTNGQLATVASRILVALPKALKLSGLDTKSVIRHTGDGKRLTLALAEAFRMLYNGHAATIPEYFIDFDAAPFTPSGWSVLPDSKQLPNRVRGKMKFDPTKVNLHLDDDQRNGKGAKGNNLRKNLENLSVYGAQLLDFYIKNPHLIPEKWKGKVIFFWGTIYCDSLDSLCVRYLCSRGDEWFWGSRHLDDNIWYFGDPTALLAA